ncbi:MAG: 5-formyltetrahydrofolate cyclo-ligase [Clostridiales bacterium]|nr:5-formyltetrahydrofolate cyclo-ligase [Clostridiales bacterium]
MYEIRKRKNEIRDKYKQLREKLDRGLKAEMDERICRAFLDSATYRFASVILLYAPKANEVDVNAIAVRALADGKKIAYPRCNGENRSMSYHFVESLDQLKSGLYGIFEPSAELPVYDRGSTEPAACIVPALVYDKFGYRIGYGKGFYDRYLGSFTGSKVGMIYSDYIIDQLPRGRYDLSVDFLVTERGIRIKSN